MMRYRYIYREREEIRERERFVYVSLETIRVYEIKKRNETCKQA